MLNQNQLTRRTFCALGTTVATAATLSAQRVLSAEQRTSTPPQDQAVKPTPFRFGLNCSILLGYNLPLEKELELVHQGGFRYVEIWIDHLRKYQASGKKLSDLRQWLSDHELKVINGIGFARWSVDDETVRKQALIQLREEMELLSALDCPYIAAPIIGITDKDTIDKIKILAERYRTILETGVQTGVRPILELWGPTPIFSDLAYFSAIAFSACHKEAALLLDAYHLYRGGNSFENLNLLSGKALPVFHLNDYPKTDDRKKLKDSDRVFPGDGVCPLKDILSTLRCNGFNGVLSLELFNKEYQRAMKPQELVQACYQKMEKLIVE